MMTEEARGRRYTKEQRDRQAEGDKEATEKRKEGRWDGKNEIIKR